MVAVNKGIKSLTLDIVIEDEAYAVLLLLAASLGLNITIEKLCLDCSKVDVMFAQLLAEALEQRRGRSRLRDLDLRECCNATVKGITALAFAGVLDRLCFRAGIYDCSNEYWTALFRDNICNLPVMHLHGSDYCDVDSKCQFFRLVRNSCIVLDKGQFFEAIPAPPAGKHVIDECIVTTGAEVVALQAANDGLTNVLVCSGEEYPLSDEEDEFDGLFGTVVALQKLNQQRPFDVPVSELLDLLASVSDSLDALFLLLVNRFHHLLVPAARNAAARHVVDDHVVSLEHESTHRHSGEENTIAMLEAKLAEAHEQAIRRRAENDALHAENQELRRRLVLYERSNDAKDGDGDDRA